MTIVVWDGKTLAADKMAMRGEKKCYSTTKIARLDDGRLFGYSGYLTHQQLVFDWINSGAKPSDWPKDDFIIDPDYQAIVVNLDGTFLSYDDSGKFPMLFEEKCHAIGSGSVVAFALFEVDRDAVECVEIANKIMDGCGNGIDTLTLE